MEVLQKKPAAADATHKKGMRLIQDSIGKFIRDRRLHGDAFFASTMSPFIGEREDRDG